MSGIKKHQAWRLAGAFMLLQLLAWGSCSRGATIDVTLTNLKPGAWTLHFTVTDMNSGAARFQASLDQAVSRLQLDAGLLTTNGPFLLRVQALDELPCTFLSGTSDKQGFSLSGSRAEVSVALKTVDDADDPCSVSVSLVGQEKEGVRVKSVPAGIDCPNVACNFRFKHGAEVKLHYELSNPAVTFGGWDGPTEQCRGLRGASATTRGEGCTVTIPAVEASDGQAPIAVVAEAAPWQRCRGDLCFDSPHDTIKVLWGSSEKDVWAGGPDGMLHFDGARWRIAPDAPTGVTSLWGRGPRDVWAVGADPLRRGSNAVFHWDGKWSLVEEYRKYRDMRQVSGNVNNGDIWFVGRSTNAVTVSSLYHLSGGFGGVMEEIPFSEKVFADDGIGFFAGISGDVWMVNWAGEISHYSSAQKSWIINEYVPPKEPVLSALFGYSDSIHDELWLVGMENRLAIIDSAVATHFDGKNWRQYHLDPFNAADKTNGKLYAVWAKDNVVWLLGTHSSFRGVRPNRDAAFQWERLTGEIPATLWGADPQHVFGAGAPGEMLVNDGDKPKFKRLESVFPVQPLYGLSGSHRRDVWAVGDRGTVLHWDGDRWSRVEATTQANLRGAWGDGKDGVWIVGEKGTLLHCQMSPPPSQCVSISTGTLNDLTSVWGSAECPSSGCQERQVWAVGALDTVLNCSLRGCLPSKGWMGSGRPRDFNGVWGKSNGDVWLIGTEIGLLKLPERAVLLHGTADPKAPPAYLPSLSWAPIEPAQAPIWHAKTATSIWGDPRGVDLWVATAENQGCRLDVDYDELWHRGGMMNDWKRELGQRCSSFSSLWGSGPDDVWGLNGTLTQVSPQGPPYSVSAGFPLKALWGSGRGELWTVGSDGERGVIVRRRAP